jgi:hypothetical protein
VSKGTRVVVLHGQRPFTSAAADKPDTPPPPRAGGVRTRSLTVRARLLTAAEAAATRSN